MTLLTVWDDTAPDEPVLRTEDAGEIAGELGRIGVRFERWPLRELGPEPTQDDVLAAYRAEVDEVVRAHGYGTVDVVSIAPSDDPGHAERVASSRARFLDEHTHDDDEDRFFARGSGVFYLHAAGRVSAVLCEAGDLLSVPADTTHWFDMGTDPDYVSVRFFHDDDGWVAAFTGSTISRSFPTFDQLVAGRRALARA